MKLTCIPLMLCGLTLAATLCCSGAAGLGGGILITIDNDPTFSRDIDPAQDSVEIMLMPIVTEKRSNLLKADSEAGVLVSVNVHSQDVSNEVHSVKIPQLYLVDVKEYRPGQVMLPLEKSVLTLPSLRPPKSTITRTDLDITVIRRQSD